MSFINPNIKFTQVAQNVVWAKLEGVTDKSLIFHFPTNPESVSWSHESNFKLLPVLDTAQPQVKYNSSESMLRLSNLKLWSPGMSGSIQQSLKTLEKMTKPGTDGKPPLLKLTWGNLIESSLYLKSVYYDEQQWRSGQATSAVGNLEFIRVPSATKAQATEVAMKLTPAEQKSYEDSIVKHLKANPTKAKQMGITPSKGVDVKEDGTIYYGGKVFGRLKDTFPNLVKPKNKTL